MAESQEPDNFQQFIIEHPELFDPDNISLQLIDRHSKMQQIFISATGLMAEYAASQDASDERPELNIEDHIASFRELLVDLVGAAREDERLEVATDFFLSDASIRQAAMMDHLEEGDDIAVYDRDDLRLILEADHDKSETLDDFIDRVVCVYTDDLRQVLNTYAQLLLVNNVCEGEGEDDEYDSEVFDYEKYLDDDSVEVETSRGVEGLRKDLRDVLKISAGVSIALALDRFFRNRGGR